MRHVVLCPCLFRMSTAVHFASQLIAATYCNTVREETMKAVLLRVMLPYCQHILSLFVDFLCGKTYIYVHVYSEHPVNQEGFNDRHSA